MKRVGWVIIAAAAALLVSRPASAGQVYCGSILCFEIKVAVGSQSSQSRTDRAMDVLNKHLGGRTGSFSLRAQGSDVQILLNGDLMVTVTPADARAMRAHSAQALAKSWRAAVVKAFEATKAEK